MVLLVLTPRLRNAMEEALACPEFDELAKKRLRNCLEHGTFSSAPSTPVVGRMCNAEDSDSAIEEDLYSAKTKPRIGVSCVPIDLVKQVSVFLVEKEKKMGKDISLSKFWLHDLLDGSNVYAEPVKKPRVQSSDLLARIERAVALDDNELSSKPTTPITPTTPATPNRLHHRMSMSSPRRSKARRASRTLRHLSSYHLRDIHDVDRHALAMLNVAIAMFAIFAAVFCLSYQISTNITKSLGFAGFASCIVLAAEVFTYLYFLSPTSSPIRRAVNPSNLCFAN